MRTSEEIHVGDKVRLFASRKQIDTSYVSTWIDHSYNVERISKSHGNFFCEKQDDIDHVEL